MLHIAYDLWFMNVFGCTNVINFIFYFYWYLKVNKKDVIDINQLDLFTFMTSSWESCLESMNFPVNLRMLKEKSMRTVCFSP